MKARSGLGVCRYGSFQALLRLAVEHNELRTLQRVLSSAGPQGTIALWKLCHRMKQAVEEKASLELQGESDSKEVASLNTGLFDRFTAEHLLQLLYRGYLSLKLNEAAGKMSQDEPSIL